MQNSPRILPSESLLRVLSGSFASGGSFLFIEEGMTLGAKELLRLLQQHCIGKVPFAIKSLWTLQHTSTTQRRDVLFVGDIGQTEAEKLAKVCLCKIVKEKSMSSWTESLFDFEWDPENVLPTDIIKIFTHVTTDQKSSPGGAALFLDRDDVIVRNVPYNKDPAQVELVPGVIELIQKAHKEEKLVIVCSNQSGIGRGLISPEQYQQVHQRMLQLIATQGGWIDDCFWASYISSNSLANELLEPQMRKPRPGMYLLAAERWPIDLAMSKMVGDSATDLIAAYHAGVRDLYLFNSEKLEQEKISLMKFQEHYPHLQYHLVHDLTSI